MNLCKSLRAMTTSSGSDSGQKASRLEVEAASCRFTYRKHSLLKQAAGSPFYSGLRALCACFAFFVAQNSVTQAHAATYPQWWIDQGVITSGQQPPPGPNDPGYDQATYDAWVAANFAPANAGQAKNLAAKAMAAMEQAQTGSAGTTITTMVNGFSTTAEEGFVLVNIGQVKALAAPFFDRMHAEGFTVTLTDGTTITAPDYPWNPSTPIAQNYAPANIGQLKHVFSFDLAGWPPAVDADGDGLPDWWELLYGDDPSTPYVSEDRDYDGLDSLQEYALGTNPNLFDSNNDGVSDGFSVVLSVDPVSNDLDGDGLSNEDEWIAGTNLLVADTDGDGVNDGLDIAPLDPALSALPASDPGDVTAPVITLYAPEGAVLL